MIIEDGTGKGYKSKVNKENRLEVDASVVDEIAVISENEGRAFVIATEGFVSLSTTAEHGIMYLKYEGDGVLHIDSIRTCGTGAQRWKMYKDSTAGTLISGGTDVTANNLNFSSSNNLVSIQKRGADGSTVTDGTIIENWINNGGHSIEEFKGALILAKGDSLSITCETSGTLDVCVRINAYEHI